MKLQTDTGLEVELAPFMRDDVGAFLPGFQKASITRYLHQNSAQTLETEQEWYDSMIRDQTSRTWGIWAVEDTRRHLIGTTSIEQIRGSGILTATTGIVIVDDAYHGRGIATATHRARSWYAFNSLAITRLVSYVYDGNGRSRHVIEKVGYSEHHETRNECFANGKWMSVHVMECLNPDDWAWRLWWGSDRPPRKNLEARRRTEEALEWARAHVTLL